MKDYGGVLNDIERGNWSIWKKKFYTVWGKWMNVYGGVVEDTERGKQSSERKTFFSLGVSWINVYGEVVDWNWQGKIEELGAKNYTYCLVDKWMCMDQDYIDREMGNWSIGRKQFYILGGKWMNVYGAVLMILRGENWSREGEKHYTVWVVSELMSMQQWWNNTDKGKLIYWEKCILKFGW